MSTYEYRPNGNGTEPVYKIGTIGWEYKNNSVIGKAMSLALDAMRTVNPVLGPIASTLYGLIDGDGGNCPTYGLWAGQGWAGGQRLPNAENNKIDWTTSPCYNESIKQIATNPNINPENCYSLVDAITKTHDWMYTQAENQYAEGTEERKKAYLAADVVMLQNIATALETGSYISQTGIYNTVTGTWSEKTYTGTLDSTETKYLTALVPLFMGMIYYKDESVSGVFENPAENAVIIIASHIPLVGTIWEDSAEPSNKNVLEKKDDIIIMQQERTSSTTATIMDIGSANTEPVNVCIEYGAGSTKAADAFAFKDTGTNIIINGGSGHDDIKIIESKNEGSSAYEFEIAGGGGNDTYYLDRDFDYKLNDSGENTIYIEDNNGKWVKIGNLFKATDGAWKSLDGSIVLTDRTITLNNGSTIELNDNFQSGDFGINLIAIPDNPVTTNPILGDLTPVDFNPDEPGIQTQTDEWGNVITDSGQPSPGREDALSDTTANDLLNGGSGNDFIVSERGGSDLVLGGEGNDYIIAEYNANNIVVECGTGRDIAYGGRGNDRIFGENYGEMSDLIAAGETATNINGYWDVASGGGGQIVGEKQVSDGEDYIYGSNASDVLLGGTGKDLLVGGGGDDVILGDRALACVDRYANWSFSIVDYGVSFTNLAMYAPLPDDVDYALQEDDVIYGGTGNDYASGGGGDDEIYGGAGDDTLVGDASEAGLPIEFHGADFIEGGDGNDATRGNGGDDYIDGGAGMDSLYGNQGADEMFGGTGNDYMEGDNYDVAGNDYLDGEDGNDTLIGGGGTDEMFGGAGNDQLHGDSSNVALADQGDDYIDGEGGDNLLVGYGGNDTLIAAEGNDTIYGDAGDDYVDAGDGINTIYGGTGNDEIYAGTGDDQISGGAGYNYMDAGGGNNVIVGGAGTDTIFAGSGNNQIQADAGDDYIETGDGNNIITGGDGNDTIYVGNGSNQIWGGAGQDEIYGGAGDDRLYDEGGASVIYGGAGNDYVQVTDGNSYLDGGDGNDTIIGATGSDTIYGGSGNDYLQGGTGNDTYVFSRGNGSDIIENYAADYATAIDTVQYGAAINEVTVTRENNDLRISIEGTTDSLLIWDWFSGAAYQFDRFIFSDGTILSATDMEGKIANIVYGSAYNEVIYGLGLNNKIYGFAGTDSLYGASGNDTLDGGTGNDYLQGAAGSDTYVFGRNYGADLVYDNDTTIGNLDSILLNSDTQPEAAILNRSGNDLLLTIAGTNDTMTVTEWFNASGANKVEQLRFADGTKWDAAYIEQHALPTGSAGNDTLTGTSGIDLLSGLGGNDILYGYEGNDTLNGGSGIDTLIGGAGNDTYIVFDDTSDVVIESTGEGIDTVKSTVNYTLSENIENLTLTGTYGIHGTGNALDNIISTNAAGDTLSGGAGNDTIDSSLGYYGDLYGNEGDDQLIGGNGRNMLDGGLGVDMMIGGNGSDTYIVDNVDDVIIENANEGSDTIQSSITYTLGANVESLYLTGTSAINGTGNELDNYIEGNSSANYLIGGDGNDAMWGEEGDDTLDGGTGNDYLRGDNGNDTFIFGRGYGQDRIDIDSYNASNVDVILLGADISPADITLRRDLVNESWGLVLSINGTSDTLTISDWLLETGAYVIDYIKFADGTIWDSQTMLQMTAINGTSGNDTLSGLAAPDTINGLAGNDILYGYAYNDTMDGGTGADTMIGGTENDSYFVDDAGDVVTENSGEGTDTVNSSITYALGSNLENLALLGTSAINGVGNTLRNYIMGNSAVNALIGGDGDDTLDGGAGVDNLIGGLGNDTYVVDDAGDLITEMSKGGKDLIQSSVTYTLGAYVENLALTGTAAINGTGNTLDNALIGNSADNTLTGSAGNDTLDGSTGADTLIGNAGNDTYIIDNAGDVIIENVREGTDTVKSWINYTLGNNIENLTLLGADAINAAGNSLANVITGNSMSNFIDGGAGADKMIGGAGDDTYLVDNVKDVITENSGEGTDVVQSSCSYTLGANVENLILTGTAAISGTGNALDNYEIGNSAANTLTGGDGNDTLDGGAGADKLVGGDGSDTYYVDNPGDIITESSRALGYDTVNSSVSYTLSANVENLILSGTDPINGTGNSLNNILTGNSANNILTGDAGSDTITGGNGNDTLDGGAGSDAYLFDRIDGSDTMTETAGLSGDIDTLKLIGGITTTEPVLVKQDNDLYVFIDSDNYMKIVGEFQQTNYGIERLEVSDGHYITRQDIDNIVNTMSTINKDPGMDVMQKYNAMMADQQYQNILAQSWQSILY